LSGVLRKKLRFPRSHGAALIQRQRQGALYPLDTALTRPLSTFPDSQNAPSVEQVPPPCAASLRDSVGKGKVVVGFLTGPHTKSKIRSWRTGLGFGLSRLRFRIYS
jgi:hypothetical protein